MFRSFVSLIPDCSALSCSHNPQNIRNPLIFLRKMATYSCFGGDKGQKSSCKQACVRLLTFIPWYHTYSKPSMRPRRIPCRLLPGAAVYIPCQTPCSRTVCIFPAVHLRSGMPDLLFLRSLAYCISFWHRMLPILLSAAYRIPE